jgi:hypothetical protein
VTPSNRAEGQAAKAVCQGECHGGGQQEIETEVADGRSRSTRAVGARESGGERCRIHPLRRVVRDSALAGLTRCTLFLERARQAFQCAARFGPGLVAQSTLTDWVPAHTLGAVANLLRKEHTRRKPGSQSHGSSFPARRRRSTPPRILRSPSRRPVARRLFLATLRLPTDLSEHEVRCKRRLLR